MPPNFLITDHALIECKRRQIPLNVLHQVLEHPEQEVSSYDGRIVYQSLWKVDGRTFLVRAIIEPSTCPPRVITVYRTSKLAKYWRTENESDL